jgi:ribose 5-phosphate isomerase A
MDEAQRGKEAAARAAADLIVDGMLVGLGSGSTAEIAVRLVAERCRTGLQITGVPTSERTAALAKSLGILLADLNTVGRLDLTIDGADEVDPARNLIKGHGGALLREKLVAEASDRLVIVVDDSKLVRHLGERFPVPVEVVPFGWITTARRLEALALAPELRGGASPYITDGHNYVLDCRLQPHHAGDRALAERMKALTGVVEHGLFLDMAGTVLVGYSSGEVVALTP